MDRRRCAVVSIMGTRVVRTEDPAFLTRGGTYTADLALPGALHLTLVRSPVAHARIASVDVAEARSAPGVVDVVTGAEVDLAPVEAGARRPRRDGAAVPRDRQGPLRRRAGRGRRSPSRPTRARTPPSWSIVDYDPLPAVVDLRAAARDEVLLFDEAGTNTVVGFGLEKPLRRAPLRRLRGRGHRRDRQPAARRRAARDPRRRGAVGRRRPADAVVLDAERPGHARRGRGLARASSPSGCA